MAKTPFGFIFVSLLLLGWKSPDEGMWLLGDLPMDAMKARGLQLSAEQIFHPTEPSLEDAIMLLGGGTGSFVSEEGLILTNYHVAYDDIGSISTVEKDYLNGGFLASSREEEIALKGLTIVVTKNIIDVTDEIRSTLADTLSVQRTSELIKDRSREIEKRYSEKTGLEASVVNMFNGIKFYVLLTERLFDVRLVYAPPSSIGKFGGQVDNWMWPRHTGDFCFLRAYTADDGKPAFHSLDNRPYRPVKYLPISSQGVNENLFVMAMGFPGSTYRWSSSYSLALASEETYPLTRELYGLRIDIMKQRAAHDRSVGLKLAGNLGLLENTYKYLTGMLEGINKHGLLQWKQSEEIELVNFIASDPELQKRYGSVLSGIREAYAEVRTYNRKLRILSHIISASDMVQLANRFAEFAWKKAEKKLSARDENNLKEYVRRLHRKADLESEKEILTKLLIKALDLPANQKLETVEEIVNGKRGERRMRVIELFVKKLYNKSKLVSVSGCNKLMSEKAGKIQKDKFVRLALQLLREQYELGVKSRRFSVIISRLRMRLAEMRTHWKGTLGYPDGNRTLRLSYGTVRGLRPRDGVHYDWVTRLSGVIEKEKGKTPFAVPSKLREVWEEKEFGSYYDTEIGDVPVCFLSDIDMTGGNSGSPILNGKGEMVGVTFDGNWEGIIGDYRYDPPLNRTVSVDSRYILFILDKFANAEQILRELDIR